MKPLHERIDADFAQQLDRLVDGELPEAQRRQLLLALDAQPDGWRRCALAFLEAQSWRRELASLGRAAEPMLARPHDPEASSRPDVQPVRGRMAGVGLSLALAASLVLAFGLGWAAHPSANGHVADAPLVEIAKAPELEDRDELLDALVTSELDSAARWETVTLSIGRDALGREQQLELPVLDCDVTDLAALERETPLVPIELREALERLGHRVSEQRRLVTVRLEDGRQVVVPVDEIELRPTATATYQ